MVDAERTTPMTFAETIIGRELACSPGFFASRPPTYEQAVKEVRDFVMTVKRVRDEGRVADDVSAIVVVDSMRKLVPANILAKILADPDKPRRGKDGGVDGMGGRAAQIKAAMNAAWLDELVPLLEETRCAFVAIARETDDMEAEAWEEDFKVGGGKALTYDSSLLLRVTRAGYVQKGKSGDENADKNRPVYGERHRVTIRKTKLSAQETKRTLCHFHTSNGVLEGVPEGLDRARDVLELAERFGVVRRAGSWYSWERKRWQGEDAAVQKLSGDPETLDAIEAEMRINFAEQSPIEVECADG
jgi:RecA/RadA recombinase